MTEPMTIDDINPELKVPREYARDRLLKTPEQISRRL